MFTTVGNYQIWVMDIGSLLMNLVRTWRVVIEVKEFGEHMVNGLTRQVTGVGACWGETEFGFRYGQSRLSTQYHFEG